MNSNSTREEETTGRKNHKQRSAAKATTSHTRSAARTTTKTTSHDRIVALVRNIREMFVSLDVGSAILDTLGFVGNIRVRTKR